MSEREFCWDIWFKKDKTNSVQHSELTQTDFATKKYNVIYKYKCNKKFNCFFEMMQKDMINSYLLSRLIICVSKHVIRLHKYYMTKFPYEWPNILRQIPRTADTSSLSKIILHSLSPKKKMFLNPIENSVSAMDSVYCISFGRKQFCLDIWS